MSDSLSGYKVGFVGLGNMGWPMARHLHAASAELEVWNRSAGPRNRATDAGISVAFDLESLGEHVRDGILCLNLTHTSVVAEMVERVVEHLEPEAVVIDFGTTGYRETLKFTRLLRERDIHWVDAPVSGGQVGAEAGNLTIFCGAEEEVFARVLPLLEVVGNRITRLGGPGAGQVGKLANQLIVAQTIDAVAQALRLGELAGVDSGRLREALRGGFAESRILDLHGDRMVRRDFVAGGRSELQLKDVRLIAELASEVGLDSPTLRNSKAQWEHFVEVLGNGDLDHSGLFRLYEDET